MFCKFCGANKGTAELCPNCEQEPVKVTEEKSGSWLMTLGVVLLSAIAILFFANIAGKSASDLSTYSAPVPSAPTLPATYEVAYKVGGTCGRASMTYANSQGGTEQTTRSLPWTQAYYTMGRGDFAYVSAQNERNAVNIYCEIFVNGVSWKKSSSSGGYSIASCSGSVGE